MKSSLTVLSHALKESFLAIFLLALFFSPAIAQEIVLDNTDATYRIAGGSDAGIVILMYHGLDEPFGQDPARFEAQMQYLDDQGYETMTLDDLRSWIETGLPEPPAKPIVLTFDDNYLSIYTVAYPSLKAHGFVGYNFAHTNYVGVVTSYDHADWIECGTMETDGVIFTESHTKTHPNLTSLSEIVAREELAGSKAAIEANLSKTCRHLAYPYGGYDASVIAWAQEAGYETAVTTNSGVNTRSTPLMELYRFGVNPSTAMETFISYVSQSGGGGGAQPTDWTHSTSEPGYWGTDYQYVSGGTGTTYAEWTISPSQTGEYELFTWYTAHSNRASNAPYTIEHNAGTTTVRIDQTQNGRQWVSLGTYPFIADVYYTVRLSNDANGIVISDAIRLVPLESNVGGWQVY